MKHALLFDLDGTLTDTLPLYLKSYDLALTEQGIHLTDKAIVDNCFGKTEEIICNRLGIPKATKQFQETYFNGVRNHYIKGRLFPGVSECLSLAKEKGLKLGIISFAYNWYVDEMVKSLDLNSYFDVIIGHNDVAKPKPDPEAVLQACQKIDVAPTDSIMIGDSSSDIVMGNSAGCTTVLFHPKNYCLFYDLATLKKSSPTHIIGNFAELKPIIDNLI